MNTSTTSAPEAEPLRASDLPAGQNPDRDADTTRPKPVSTTGLAESIATGVALVVCVTARLPHRLLDASGIHGWVGGLVLVVAVVIGARALARAPFTYRRFSNRNEWLANELKAFVAAAVVGAAFTLPLYALLRATSAWWLLAWILFAAVTVAGQVAMPFTLRLQSGPLAPADPPLAERVEAVAARAGVDVGGGVLVAGKPSSRHCNAYVVGLGPTRRVVLETGIAAWPPDVVDQVVAHEIGHWRLGHGAVRLPVTIAVQLATFFLAALVLSSSPLLEWAGVAHAGDPRSYPLLLLLTPLLALPARSLLAWRDRAQELAADRFALTLLDSPEHFGAMLERAADEGGAPRRLSWWRRLTASHPSIGERALACTRFASTA